MIYLVGFNSSLCQDFIEYNCFRIDNNYIALSQSKPIKSSFKSTIIVQDYFTYLEYKLKEGDRVIYFSGLTNLKNCEQNEELCLDVNFTKPLKLVDLCHKRNSKIILFSSAAVYGDQVNEKKFKPISIYGSCKLKMENEAVSFPNVMILRLFSTYGLNQKKLFIHEFLKRCQAFKKNQSSKIISYSSPGNTRDYIHLNGISELLYYIVNGGFSQGIHPISTGQSVKMVDIEEYILSYLGISKAYIESRADLSFKPTSWSPIYQNIPNSNIDLTKFKFPYKFSEIISDICAE